MNVERIPAELSRRVAVHAALADPTRLQVVDTLAVGDAASSELSERLAIASNLLAHHLKVLEAAGVIERHRSEGDRRRSYWRLARRHLGDASPAVPTGLTVPQRVVFVCTANAARSHLAAALWRQASAIPVASAGTRPADRVDRGAVAAARRHHLDLPDVRPRHLRDVLDGGDLVVTVCDLAHEELGEHAAVHWSVPDPAAAATRAAFDHAHDELADRVRVLAPLLERAS